MNLGKEFAKGEKLLVILGDNIFNYPLKEVVEKFEQQERGAVVFGINKNTESRQYGVIEMDSDGKVLSIEEKPEHPKSPIAQSGIYMYDERVFDFIRDLKPSGSTLRCEILDWWIDAGTSHDELLTANKMVYDKVQNGEL